MILVFGRILNGWNFFVIFFEVFKGSKYEWVIITVKCYNLKNTQTTLSFSHREFI